MGGDVVDLVERDHREVRRLLDELKDREEQRASLLPVLTTLLTAHSRAEEAEIYPVAASVAADADAVWRERLEHLKSQHFLAKLARTDPATVGFEETLLQLVDTVSRHVDAEEAKILPSCARLPDNRRAELHDAFVASRNHHLSKQPKARHPFGSAAIASR